MLQDAHEGYEYQDYLTVAIIFDELLNRKESSFVIDRKSFSNDKFDDLKVINTSYVDCYQIKYSNEENNHIFEKSDLANGNDHDIAVSDLYFSWKNLKKQYENVNCYLCVAWKDSKESDGLRKVLQKADVAFFLPSVSYRIDPEKLWPMNQKPLGTWIKLRRDIQGESREDFVKFCRDFRIIVEMPKASIKLDNPGQLENILLEQVRKLGVGIYPNEKVDCLDVIDRIAIAVKKWRATGTTHPIAINDIIKITKLISDYGILNDHFPINEAIYITDLEQISGLKRKLDLVKKLVLVGNPGTGKSWLVEGFVKELKKNKYPFIRFNCYTELSDKEAEKRIDKKILISNLIGQLVEQFELESYKLHRFSADKEELENLLTYVKDKCYVIVDGLDHINRQYDIYKGTIGKDETAIIEELRAIHFPDNFYILLSSQPISELDELYCNGYQNTEIQRWNHTKIEQLMRVCGLENICEGERKLSYILEEKSQGNVLYLSYLLKEMACKNYLLQDIENIPAYDNGLKTYYQYIIGKIQNTTIIYALAGADFYVNPAELKEITGYGDEVDSGLLILSPILNDNFVSGGVQIYHESFRRYIFEKISEKKMDVRKVVYQNINDWMEKLDFFGNSKSYCHRLKLLYRVEEYAKVLSLMQPEFVIESIKFGYSYFQILDNLNMAMKCSGEIQDYCGTVLISELMNVLETTQYEVAENEAFYHALAVVKGAEYLSNRLEYNGKPTFGLDTGKNMCYICSQAGIATWWEIYLDTNKTSFLPDEYKYYFRYWIDNKGTSLVYKVMDILEESVYGESFVKEILEDAISYEGINEIHNYAKQHGLKTWLKLLNIRKFYFYEEAIMPLDEFSLLYEKVKSIKHPVEEDVDLYRKLFGQIYLQIRNNNYKFFSMIHDDWRERNWFGNWMIYTADILKLFLSYESGEEVSETELLETVGQLILDTEPFLGNPRACDLYALENFLLETYYLALAMAGSDNALEGVLNDLSVLSRETTTTSSNSQGGPLTDYNFIKLMRRIINARNLNIILPYAEDIVTHSANATYYASTATIKFLIADMIAEADQKKAEKYYEEGVKFLVGYTMHKDMSLDSVIDSFASIHRMNPAKAMQCVDEITAMTFSLLQHTDERAVRHYPNIWFRKMLYQSPQYALSYLNNFQIEHHLGWILEEMILDVIQEFADKPEYETYIITLIETLPNCISEKLFYGACKILVRLFEYDKERAKSLVVNLLSRFNLNETIEIYHFKCLSKDLNIIINLAEESGMNVTLYKEYCTRCNKEDTDRNLDYDKSKHQTIDFQNRVTLIMQLSKVPLTDAAIPLLINLMKELNENKQCAYLDAMMEVDYFGENSYNQRDYIKCLLEDSSIKEEIRVRYYVKLFVKSRSYGQLLIDKGSFLRAYNINPNLAVYELFSQISVGMGGMITSGLINMLVEIPELQFYVEKTWDVLILIERLRFPVLDKMDTFGDETISIADSMRGIVLGRMFHGEKERFFAAYAYLKDIVLKGNWIEVQKCINWCVCHFEQYDYIGKMAVIDYALETIDHIDNPKDIISKFLRYFPTNDFLMDTLIAYLCDEVQAYGEVMDMFNKNLTGYLKSKYHISLGECKGDIAWNPLFDRHMRIMSRLGIEEDKVYKRILNSEYVQDGMDPFSSSLHKFTVENTFLKSMIIQYSVLELIKVAIQEDVPEMPYMVINEFYIDFSEMDMYRRCRRLPNVSTIHNLQAEKKLEEFTEKQWKSEFVEIASFEIEKYSKGERDYVFTSCEKGIVLRDTDTILNRILIGSSMFEIEYNLNDCKEACCAVYESYDSNFETERYLWLRADIAYELGIYKENDYQNNRIIGVAEDGTTVLIMQNWRCAYIGDNEHRAMEVPLYNGAILYMRRDYIEKLKNKYGQLYYATEIQKA